MHRLGQCRTSHSAMARHDRQDVSTNETYQDMRREVGLVPGEAGGCTAAAAGTRGAYVSTGHSIASA
eukprot:3535963-Rhodomonas_salina.4